MTNQIFDRRTLSIPGPSADASPEMIEAARARAEQVAGPVAEDAFQRVTQVADDAAARAEREARSTAHDIVRDANIPGQIETGLRTRVPPIMAEELAKDSTLAAGARAALSDAVVGMNLLEATRGTLPNGADFNELYDASHAGSYNLNSTFTYLNAPPLPEGAILRVWVGNRDTSVLHEVTSGDRSFWRESWLATQGIWDDWHETAKVADMPLPMSAHRLLELARSDGWLAVYDPTNPKTRQVTQGRIASISDGLGNYPDIAAGNLASRPYLSRRGFGDLDAGRYGVDGVASALRAGLLDNAKSQPTFVLTVAQSDVSDVGSSGRYIVDGQASNGRNAILASATNDGKWSTYAGNEFANRDHKLDRAPHTFGALFNGRAGSRFFIDGVAQFGSWAGSASNDHPMSGITVGNRFASTAMWRGLIGPVLVYDGVPTDAVRERMTRLLSSLAGEGGRHVEDTLVSRTAVYRSRSGSPVYSKDADSLQVPASITKVVTATLARQTISDGRLDEVVTVKDSDPISGSAPALRVGDQISYRNLLYLAMLPSHNVAARLLARAVGEQMSGSGDPEQVFIAAMNSMVESWGWDGATFATTSGLGTANRMSANMAAELLYRVSDNDAVLLDIMGTLSHVFDVEGPNARSLTATHTINPNGAVRFPEFVAGKTGTLASVGGSVAMLVRNGDGGLDALVVMNANPIASRYVDARKMLDGFAAVEVARGADTAASDSSMSQNLSDPNSLTRAGLDQLYSPLSHVTPQLDLDLSGVDLSSSGARIAIQRRGDMVELMVAAVGFTENQAINAAIPPEFRPAGFAYAQLFERATGKVIEAQVNSLGRLEIRGNTENSPLRGTFVWLTSAAFPEAHLYR